MDAKWTSDHRVNQENNQSGVERRNVLVVVVGHHCLTTNYSLAVVVFVAQCISLQKHGHGDSYEEMDSHWTGNRQDTGYTLTKKQLN